MKGRLQVFPPQRGSHLPLLLRLPSELTESCFLHSKFTDVLLSSYMLLDAEVMGHTATDVCRLV